MAVWVSQVVQSSE